MENLEISMTVVWAVLGIGLCIAELLTGTFVLLLFGLSALIVALARLIGLDSLPWEIALFAVSSIASLLLFRDKLTAALDKGRDGRFANDEGAVIVLNETLAPGHEGKIQYQGSDWTAVNESPLSLEKGQKVVIYRTEGNRLYVKPIVK